MKSTWPSRRSGYSLAKRLLDLEHQLASPQASSIEPIFAPTASYASSGNELPSPAPSRPERRGRARTSSRAPAGVSATRYSSVLISLTTPIFIGGAKPKVEQQSGERSWRPRSRPGRCSSSRRQGQRTSSSSSSASRGWPRRLDALGEEERHQLAAEAGDGPELRHLASTRRRSGRSPLRARAWPRRGAPRRACRACRPGARRGASGSPRVAGARGATCPSVSTATIATAPGCSTISRSLSPHCSSVTERSLPSQAVRDESGFMPAAVVPRRPLRRPPRRTRGPSSGPRPMCESGRPAQASRHPSACVADHDLAQARRRGSPAVWCERPRCRSRSSASETRAARTGRPPRARAALAAVAAASPPWPRREAVPTIPGPIAQTATSYSLRPRERGPRRHALDVPAEAGSDRRGRGDQFSRAQLPNGVGQRQRQRAALQLDVRDPQPGQRRADRRELAVQRAAHDRHAVERRRRLAGLLPVRQRELRRRVRQLHDVRAGLRLELEAARQVQRTGRRTRPSRGRARAPAC